MDDRKKYAINITTIEELLKGFQQLRNKDLAHCSVDESLKHLGICFGILNLVHGERSVHTVNYTPMEIELELMDYANTLRTAFLGGIISGTDEEYDKQSLEILWNYFIAANDFAHDSSSHCSDIRSKWSGIKLGSEAKKKLFPFLLERLKDELKGSLPEIIRDKRLRMLSGLCARFNEADPEHIKAEVVLQKYDPKNKYEFVWD